MARPTGNLVGIWKRSTTRIRKRLRLWVFGVIVSPLCCLLGPITAGGDKDLAFLTRYISFGGLFMLLMGLILLVDDWFMFRNNPDGSIEVYLDGIIMRKVNGEECFAYRWGELIGVRWPTEKGMEKIVMGSNKTPSTLKKIAHAISNEGDPLPRAVLRFTTQNHRTIVINGSFEYLEEMLPILWNLLGDYWASQIIPRLEAGEKYSFGKIWLTPEGVQKNSILLPWKDLGFAVNYRVQKVFIVGSDSVKKRHIFSEKLGVDGAGVGEAIRHFYEQVNNEERDAAQQQ